MRRVHGRVCVEQSKGVFGDEWQRCVRLACCIAGAAAEVHRTFACRKSARASGARVRDAGCRNALIL
jgi:hypothetical protein